MNAVIQLNHWHGQSEHTIKIEPKTWYVHKQREDRFMIDSPENNTSGWHERNTHFFGPPVQSEAITTKDENHTNPGSKNSAPNTKKPVETPRISNRKHNRTSWLWRKISSENPVAWNNLLPRTFTWEQELHWSSVKPTHKWNKEQGIIWHHDHFLLTLTLTLSVESIFWERHTNSSTNQITAYWTKPKTDARPCRKTESETHTSSKFWMWTRQLPIGNSVPISMRCLSTLTGTIYGLLPASNNIQLSRLQHQIRPLHQPSMITSNKLFQQNTIFRQNFRIISVP